MTLPRRSATVCLLDVVRLPDGRQGTVVERSVSHVMVEVCDEDGRALDMPEVPIADLRKLP